MSSSKQTTVALSLNSGLQLSRWLWPFRLRNSLLILLSLLLSGLKKPDNSFLNKGTNKQFYSSSKILTPAGVEEMPGLAHRAFNQTALLTELHQTGVRNRQENKKGEVSSGYRAPVTLSLVILLRALGRISSPEKEGCFSEARKIVYV